MAVAVAAAEGLVEEEEEEAAAGPEAKARSVEARRATRAMRWTHGQDPRLWRSGIAVCSERFGRML